VADQDKIAKLEEKARAIMARPTYATTPAWHQEVAELRVQIEEIRTGRTPAPRPYENPALLRAVAPVAVAAPAATLDAAPAAEGAHDDAHHEGPSYLMVFVWLTVLTAIELALAPVFGMRGLLLALGLSFFASLKALAVAFYYMHLKFEQTAMKLLLLLPVGLIVVLFALVIPDAITALRTILQ